MTKEETLEQAAQRIAKEFGISDPDILTAYAENKDDMRGLAFVISQDRERSLTEAAKGLVIEGETTETETNEARRKVLGGDEAAFTQEEVDGMDMEQFQRWVAAGAHLKPDPADQELIDEEEKAREAEVARIEGMSIPGVEAEIKKWEEQT